MVFKVFSGFYGLGRLVAMCVPTLANKGLRGFRVLGFRV